MKLSFLVYHDHKGMGACQVQVPRKDVHEVVEKEEKADPARAPVPPVPQPEPVKQQQRIPQQDIIPVMHPYDAIPSMIAIQVQNIYVGGLIGKKGVSISELNRKS